MWRTCLQTGRQTLLLVWLAAGLVEGAGREKRIVAVPAEERHSFESARNVAIVVGIDSYPDDPELSPLKFARKDASLIASALTAHGYQVTLLTDSAATKESILREVGRAGRIEGTLLFFYSGHGGEFEGRNYLVTHNAHSSALRESALAIPVLEEAMKATGALRQVLWIDACRSAVNKKSASSRSYEKLEAASGQRTLYSTGPGRSSWESDELQQGVFTHFLYQGLTGVAAGIDGFITMRDLADHVASEVGNFSKNQQMPFAGGESSGDFLIAGNLTAGMARTLGVSNLQAGVYPGANGATIVSMESPPAAALGSPASPGSIEMVARTGASEFEIVKLIGSLPGKPVNLSVSERDNAVLAEILEAPGPRNEWRRMRLLVRPESLTRPVRVVVRYDPPAAPADPKKKKK